MTESIPIIAGGALVIGVIIGRITATPKYVNPTNDFEDMLRDWEANNHVQKEDLDNEVGYITPILNILGYHRLAGMLITYSHFVRSLQHEIKSTRDYFMPNDSGQVIRHLVGENERLKRDK